MKILTTILAYNEETNIPTIIDRVRSAAPDVDIAVINDGSLDRTAQVAKGKKVIVITLPYNLGIGGAMQTGLKLGIQNGYDIIVRMDGDGQHPPEEIPRLIQPIIDGEADIVVGSRFLDSASLSKVSLPRRIGIIYFSALASYLSGRKVTDATCSYQAINQQAAVFLDRNMEQDHPEVDGWILLGRAGFQVKEIPMYIPQRQSGTSSINKIRSLYFLVKVTITALAAYRRKLIK